MTQTIQSSKDPRFFVQTRAGLKNRRRYSQPKEGSGGVYFMKDSSGEKTVSVFKPKDEEPYAVNHHLAPCDSQTLSISGSGKLLMERAGKGAAREVAAFLLDHPPEHRRESGNSYEKGFSGVPTTLLVRCPHTEGFFRNSKEGQWKVGSLQEYAGNVGSCGRFNSKTFPVEEVHKICVVDMRLANSDRNGTNILVQKSEGGAISLVPIDHGLCFPSCFNIRCKFYWLRWPQSKIKFSQETLDYIAKLDAERDIELLKSDGWKVSDGVARVLHVYTMLLKKGAERGLSPHDIGMLMDDNEPVIKKIAEEAEDEAKKEVEKEAERMGMTRMSDKFLKVFKKLMDKYLKKVFEEARKDAEKEVERIEPIGKSNNFLKLIEMAINVNKEFGKEAERMRLTGTSDKFLNIFEKVMMDEYEYLKENADEAVKEAERMGLTGMNNKFLKMFEKVMDEYLGKNVEKAEEDKKEAERKGLTGMSDNKFLKKFANFIDKYVKEKFWGGY